MGVRIFTQRLFSAGPPPDIPPDPAQTFATPNQASVTATGFGPSTVNVKQNAGTTINNTITAPATKAKIDVPAGFTGFVFASNLVTAPDVTVDIQVGGSPDMPADISAGVGAYKMIGWSGGLEGSSGATTSASQGWGGCMYGFNAARIGPSSPGFAFTGQAAPAGGQYDIQRTIEGAIGQGQPTGWENYFGPKVKYSGREQNSHSPFDWWSTGINTNGSIDNWEAWHQGAGDFINWMQGRGHPYSTLKGVRFDTEQCWWGLDTYDDTTHTDQQLIAKIEEWGYAAGRGLYSRCPGAITMVYNWFPPGGYAYDNVYNLDNPNLATMDNRAFNSGQSSTLWYGQEAAGPKHRYWIGYLRAMADFCNANAKFVRADAFYYKTNSPGQFKYETQGTIAALSQATHNYGGAGGTQVFNNFTDAQWNKLCDKIDITFFSWAGTDWNLQNNFRTGVCNGNTITLAVNGGTVAAGRPYILFHSGPNVDKFTDYQITSVTPGSGNTGGSTTGIINTTFTYSGPASSGTVTFTRFSTRTGYNNSPELASGAETPRRSQILNMRQYGMGIRRVDYVYGAFGIQNQYSRYDDKRDDVFGAAVPSALQSGFTTLRDWWTYAGTDPPGGHSVGQVLAASQSSVSNAVPTITNTSGSTNQVTKVNNGNGTYSLTGRASHPDGIRCVKARKNGNNNTQVGARLVWNKNSGSVGDVYANSYMQFTIVIAGTAGDVVDVTAYSVHSDTCVPGTSGQQHSVRIIL